MIFAALLALVGVSSSGALIASLYQDCIEQDRHLNDQAHRVRNVRLHSGTMFLCRHLTAGSTRLAHGHVDSLHRDHLCSYAVALQRCQVSKSAWACWRHVSRNFGDDCAPAAQSAPGTDTRGAKTCKLFVPFCMAQ